jgi:hypothetical protein
VTDKQLSDYIDKLCAERDTLIARFLKETGLLPSEILLVEKETSEGRIFFPDLKSKYDTTVKELK